jgi:hypothetical protein
VISFTSSLDGLQSAGVRFEAAARRIAAPPSDATDLSTDAVAMLEARNSFDANLKTAQVADEMTKSTLNILA